MTPEENGIMRDAFYFLRDHIDPPPLGTEECNTFWIQAAKDLAQVSYTWKNYPLATCVLMAIYDYLDWKCKQKAGDPR